MSGAAGQGKLAERVGMLPAVLFVAAFLLVPLGLVVAYSFMPANSFGGVDPGFSTEAYHNVLYEQRLDGSFRLSAAYLLIVWRSIYVAGLTTLIVMAISLPVAIYIARQRPRRRTFLLLMVTIPFWANILIRTFAWILLLRDTGVINGLLMAIGLISSPLPLLNTTGAVLVGLVYTFAPFMVLPIYGRMERLEQSQMEAAHDLYANRWQVFRHIVWPAALPGVVAGSLLTFIPCLGSLIAPELLGGGKQMMLGNLIYRQFSEARDWPFGAAIAVLLLVIVAAIGLLQVTLMRRKSAGKAV